MTDTPETQAARDYRGTVILPKTANLILTTAGAANAKAAQVDIFVVGELTGAK